MSTDFDCWPDILDTLIWLTLTEFDHFSEISHSSHVTVDLSISYGRGSFSIDGTRHLTNCMQCEYVHPGV